MVASECQTSAPSRKPIIFVSGHTSELRSFDECRCIDPEVPLATEPAGSTKIGQGVSFRARLASPGTSCVATKNKNTND